MYFPYLQDSKVVTKPVIEIRERFERRLDKDFSDAANDNTNLFYSRWRTGVDAQRNKKTYLRVVYQFYWDATKVDGGGQSGLMNSNLYEGYWQDQVGPVSFKAGRQEVTRGDKRLLGNSNWGQGQTWDGASFTYGSFQTFAGQLGPRSKPNHEARIGYLGFTSRLGETTAIYKMDSAPADADRVWTLDQYWTGKRGAWDLMVEATGQAGHSGGKDLGAWMGIAKAVYRANPKLQFQAEVDLASGGNSATKTSLYDSLYPSTHGLYGAMDMQGLRNTKIFNVGASYKPTSTVEIKLDYRKFFLFNKTDGWYGKDGTLNPRVGGSYIDPTGANGDDVGDEIDLVGAWKFSRNEEFQIGVAMFRPGNFIKAFNPGSSVSSYWLYASWELRF